MLKHNYTTSPEEKTTGLWNSQLPVYESVWGILEKDLQLFHL